MERGGRHGGGLAVGAEISPARERDGNSERRMGRLKLPTTLRPRWAQRCTAVLTISLFLTSSSTPRHSIVLLFRASVTVCVQGKVCVYVCGALI